MKVCSVSEMRNMNKTAAEIYGVEDLILMEDAGYAAYSVLLKEFGIRNKSFLVISGTGFNGGVGFVAARLIHSNGGKVKVVLMEDKRLLLRETRQNSQILSRFPIETLELANAESITHDVNRCDVVVDALFGIGLDKDLSGHHYDVVNLINSSRKKVVSLDLPSGIHPDTGQIMGTAISAYCTLIFGLPMIGNLLYPGYNHCGKLSVSHLSYPPAVHTSDSLKIEINRPTALPPEIRDGYPKKSGRALCISLTAKAFEKAYCSALSFLKAGGQYARLAGPESAVRAIEISGNEIDALPLKEATTGNVSKEMLPSLPTLLESTDIVILSLGDALDGQNQQMTREFIQAVPKPLIISGLGTMAAFEDLSVITSRTKETLLILDLKELSLITAKSLHEIAVAKIDIVQEIAAALNSIVVVEDAHPLIGNPDGSIFINLGTSFDKRKTGADDSPAGVIAAMHGLGPDIRDSVKNGVFIYEMSRDLAAQKITQRSLSAHDVIEYLPETLKRIRNNTVDTFGHLTLDM